MRAPIILLLAVQALGQDLISSDTAFYGESPAVYPSPNATGVGDWEDAYAKAVDFVAQLTLAEKVALTGGVSSGNGCAGRIPAINGTDFPGLCLSDGPAGIRGTNFVSSWPAGNSVGASWNRNLTKLRGIGMGKEFKVKGAQVALGPVVGPLGRIANGGRNWEGFSNDPYLAGALGADTVEGIQSVGVTASTKHFIANEQEHYRNPSGNVAAVSANIDDKTMHELYLWPFQDAVKAGTGSIMCSYNRLNNSYGCANSLTQNGLLKTELGFQGFVVSDWGAQHSGVATALAGLDMAMPSGSSFWGNNLIAAVNNGSVPESRVDDMAIRIVSTWYKFSQDTDFLAPGIGMPSKVSAPYQRIIGSSPDSKDVLLQGAIEGHVLVKNTNNALPLKSPQLISLYGYSARTFDRYAWGTPGWNNGEEARSTADTSTTQIASNGTLFTGGGSGGNMPAYLSSPYEALSQRAYDDGTHLWWDFQYNSQNSQVDQGSDACIVIGNAYAGEGADRPGLHDDFTDNLILSIASQCNNTIVVFHNAGVRLVDQFVDHPNVTALIFAHLPGQDAGRALVSLLYGDTSPSGKLPYSVPHNESDYGALRNESLPVGIYANFPQSDFTEGVYIDYRAFDQQGITPRYEFGFGLSYTTFGFSELAASVAVGANTDAYPTQPIVEGGRQDLWDVVAQVSADVANTGSVEGAEVVQLYVGIPSGPIRQLRGFEKVLLSPEESGHVTFDLTRRDLSTWDTEKQEWLLQEGEYQIYVGSSSRDLPLSSSLTI
ncbi:hypothetical protein E8E14_006981 [Neopestalotiopsis sp. 37M]|nr:hypothetical protein E8E14_006981 [Neopestalotiopsis sp. 37M]